MSKLVYLGHASFLFENSHSKIIFDPYQNRSVPNLKFPNQIEANLVLCSHDHFDHNAKELVKIVGTNNDIKVISMTVPHDHHNGTKRGLNHINMVELDGIKLVHLGDTGCVPSKETLEPFKNCDVLLAPINGFYTINPVELKQIMAIIQPRIVIPMHYYMEQYQSGYPDNGMIDLFKKEFPNYQMVKDYQIDLEQYKNFDGVLIFEKYYQ